MTVARADDGHVTSDWLAQRTDACAACHGKHGVATTPTFPTIAGQPESYLVHTLRAYRDGGRDNAIMAGQVRGLSDAEIAALAAYYHRQRGPLRRQRP
ncbi:cytochrome c [Salinisphaera sp. Q1T1-3]|nr:cytochrome c [Salinisphaera sp. Q1T1-3]